MLNKKEEDFLLDLARKSIESELNKTPLSFEQKNLSKNLTQELACFVTLTIDGGLRGCIGHITPLQALYKDIIENAKAAAFDDPRFDSLTVEELKETKIEISVLDIPQKFEYKTTEELLNYLEKNKPGVIIKKGGYQATFLPQVWDEIKIAEQFLTHLCVKAGLPYDEWKCFPELQIYHVHEFSE